MVSKITNYLGRVIKKLLKITSGNKKEIDRLFYTKDYFKGYKYIIGDYTYGKPKIVFENENANFVIGKYCSVADEVVIFLGGNHRVDWVTTYPFNVFNQEFFDSKGSSSTKGNVEIGNDVWTGFRTTILSGVRIADGAVIAACSVVTKDIGPYEIWGGNPARLLKKRFDDGQIQKLLEIQWWHWNDDKVKDNVTTLCSQNIEEFLSIHDINKNA